MPSTSISDMCIMIILIFILFDQCIFNAQAGSCFHHRVGDLCFGLSEADTNEEQCSSSYYSDDTRKELDGYAFAKNCRDVNIVPERCDVDCGLGQECQWLNGEEMCVCSKSSCSSSEINQQAICASNNMTFKSECAMEAWKCVNQQSGLYKKYDGECQRNCLNVKCPNDKICLLVKNTGEPFCYPRKHCNATSNPEPVCGTNGVTYPNICAMRFSHDKHGRTPDMAHKGPCEKKCRPNLCESNERCVYSKQSRPVCIRCQFSARFFSHSGECSMNIPVCGDDTRLHKNYCALLHTQCKKNQYIDIIEYDTCPSAVRPISVAKKFNYFNRFASFRMK